MEIFFLWLSVLVSSESSLSQQYQPADALIALQYARAAFCTHHSINTWTCGEMCDQAPAVKGMVKASEEAQIKFYVARQPPATSRRCVIAFRGTITLANWMTDASGKLVEWTGPSSGHFPPLGMEVHEGFFQAYLTMRRTLLRSIVELECSSLMITGHSLGGALATIAAMDMRANKGMRTDLWTFGSPRVGNDVFVKEFIRLAFEQNASVPSWRVTHCADPVPETGPFLYGYRHVPLEVWYDENSESYDVCSSQWIEDKRTATCGVDARGLFSEQCETISGVTNVDHLHYLGKPMAHNDLGAQCTRTNGNSLCSAEAAVGGCIIVGCFMFHGPAVCSGTTCICKPGFCSKDNRTCIPEPHDPDSISTIPEPQSGATSLSSMTSFSFQVSAGSIVLGVKVLLIVSGLFLTVCRIRVACRTNFPVEAAQPLLVA